MAAIAGYNGRVILKDTLYLAALKTYPITSWQVAWKADALDITTVESTSVLGNSPNACYIGGINDFDISFDAYYDTTLNIFDNTAFNLVPGARVGLELYLLKTSTAQRFKIVALITDTTTSLDVRGVVRWSCMAKPSWGSDGLVGLAPSNIV